MVRVDYIETVAPVTQRVEAESMSFVSADFYIENAAGASGGKHITNNRNMVPSSATYNFTESSGTYNISVCYVDEGDGASTYVLYVGGVQVDTWVANQTPAGGGDTYRIRTKTGVSIANGVQIRIQSTRNNDNELGRVDYIDISN